MTNFFDSGKSRMPFYALFLMLLLFVGNAFAQKTSLPLSTKEIQPGETTRVLAPIDADDSFLGRGLDARFLPVGQIFSPKKTEIIPTEISEYQASAHNIEESFEFDATVRYMAVSGGGGFFTNKRFSTVRAYQLTSVRTFSPGKAAANDKAVMYVSKIYYGHCFEILLEADEKTLHAKAAAQLLSFGGDIRTAASERNIKIYSKARGLTPREGDALILALSEKDFEQRFKRTKPAPIFMEVTPVTTIPVTSRPFAAYTIRPGAWNVSRVELTISGKKPNGSNWDMPILGAKTAPDPALELYTIEAKSRKSTTVSNSPTYSDTFEVIWNPNATVILQPNQFIAIRGFDRDAGSAHDYLGEIGISTDDIFEKIEPGSPIPFTILGDNGGIVRAVIYLTAP